MARVTHRDNRVNLKNINTGARLQGCQGATGEAGGRKQRRRSIESRWTHFFVTLLEKLQAMSLWKLVPLQKRKKEKIGGFPARE